ncbi:MAG TPA: SprT family zinc-dependent metalloprotease [Candidatus Paceibacterota bacterium]|nr:SprT family zinc-dependent metalloprotease [Candidatus Paceibacterota bacterium]
MKKQIVLQNKKIAYTLRKSKRARRMRIAVYCDGSIVVTTPFDLKETVAERFIREKSEWLLNKILFFKQFRGQVISKYSPAEFIKHKDQAYALAVERINHYNQVYKFKFNKINIKNQKTRWGSCSKKGNLNFNYKIALLPKRLSDYIIVHELCHIGEFNHSSKFWNLVSRAIPDYLQIRRELKKSGLNFY